MAKINHKEARRLILESQMDKNEIEKLAKLNKISVSELTDKLEKIAYTIGAIKSKTQIQSIKKDLKEQRILPIILKVNNVRTKEEVEFELEKRIEIIDLIKYYENLFKIESAEIQKLNYEKFDPFEAMLVTKQECDELQGYMQEELDEQIEKIKNRRFL